MPTSATHRPTCSGVSWRLTPSVSTTSAEPHSEAPLSPDIERLPCLATLSPAPATTNAVAVETLKVPEASPPVPHVSTSISRSVPLSAAVSSARAWTRATFDRITCAKPISSSTVSPFIRRAVRKAAICASVAVPDMMASIAPAASMRVRSRRSTRTLVASVMIGLVIRTPPRSPGAPRPAGPQPRDGLRRAPPPRGPQSIAPRSRGEDLRRPRRASRAPSGDSETQVGLLHVGAREQARPRALEHQTPILEHVAPMRELERARHVLLDEHDRRAGVVDALERLEDELHHHRCEAQARLVQQEQPRPRHEAPPDRAHLLLAARQGTGQLALALAQTREQREDEPERVGATRAIRRAAAQLEVVAHGHRGKQLTAFRHVGDAARGDLRRSEPVEPLALELDAPGADRQEPADRLQGGRLAGAVPADQRDRLTPPHLERDPRDRDQVAVAGFDPVKPEQRGHTLRPDRPPRLSDGSRCRRAPLPRSARRSSARRSAGRAPSPRACCARSTRSTR